MTPEAQRIAIAEVRGWRDCGIGIFGTTKDKFVGFNPDRPPKYWPREELPDYLNDLNAMHEAEKVLTQPQWPFYHGWIVKLWAEMPSPDYAYETHASAAMRAKALLITLNLYTP